MKNTAHKKAIVNRVIAPCCRGRDHPPGWHIRNCKQPQGSSCSKTAFGLSLFHGRKAHDALHAPSHEVRAARAHVHLQNVTTNQRTKAR